MRSLELVNGDLQFDGQNNLKIVTGDEEFKQSVNEIMQTNAGEWFLNPLHGFDRFDLLGEKYDQERTINAIFAALMQEPRIERIENIDLDFDREKRKLTINYKIIKVDGDSLEGGTTI